jgi:hypothetical protein
MKSSNKSAAVSGIGKSCVFPFNPRYAEIIQENETAYSNKNLLNSSPDLFFIAVAGEFMVLTAKFVWRYLRKIALPIKTCQAGFLFKDIMLLSYKILYIENPGIFIAFT